MTKSLTLEEALVRENGGYNIDNAFINMNFNNIRNLGEPKNVSDAVTRGFVEEKADLNFERVINHFKQFNQLISVSGSCYDYLQKDDYQFTFGGPILDKKLNELDRFNGFLVPANGVIRNFTIFSTGLIVDFPEISLYDLFNNEKERTARSNHIVKKYGQKDNPTPIFKLVKIENGGEEEEHVGSVVFYFKNIINLPHRSEADSKPVFQGTPVIEFRPLKRYLKKDENFICSVNQGDIINIRTDYTEDTTVISDVRNVNTTLTSIPVNFVSQRLKDPINFFGLHTVTITFMFKEMNFPNALKLNPLNP